ncbi:MAG: CRISPR-associated helicase Cas3' [Verrucomicrobiota bacterium]
MTYLARPNQPLHVHLRNVAVLAGSFGHSVGLRHEATLAGSLHDLGKYRHEFQDYLRGDRASSPETQHAAYGAAWAIDNNQLLQAFVIAGHHAGLHDLADIQGIPFKSVLGLPEALGLALQRYLTEAPSPDILHEPAFITGITNPSEQALRIDFAVRMLFSCLVDADRLDSALWPLTPPEDLPLNASALLEKIEAERQRKAGKSPDGQLKSSRNHIFDTCLIKAELAQGFFSLTVPTGGGKTLSAMAFALAHARKHNLRRVIVVIPYLSIIEQNASEYRHILGNDVVLENHSSVKPRPNADEEEKDALELAAENWDSPVVITTSVQFIESLLSARPSRCRKLHRIAHSVVIFDEVQTMPSHLLQPIFSVFRELARQYGVSFVFSSATQPAFLKSTSLSDGFTPGEMRPIIDDPDQLFRSLRRVNYHLPRDGETLDWSELARRMALPENRKSLCVVNLTKHAAELWDRLRSALPEPERRMLFHLSSAMCPAHRLRVIRLMRWLLCHGHPCRVVSTQLIEAGVDVDFPTVWRALGPLDSIVQTAGRCNREGRSERGNVHVFRPVEHKIPGGVYSAATGQATIAVSRFNSLEDAEDALATDPGIFTGYFHGLYQSVDTDLRKDGYTIQEERERLNFRTVGERAKVIDSDTQPVIVTYAAGKRLVQAIGERQQPPGTPRFTRDDQRSLQRYMVNLRQRDFDQLLALRLIEPLLPNLNVHVLHASCYHAERGLVLPGNHSIQDMIV